MKTFRWFSAVIFTLLIAISLREVSWRSIELMKRRLEEPRRLEETDSPVIVFLVQRDNTNLDDLCLSLKTLVNIQGDIHAPVLSFYLEATPSLDEQDYLQSCTDRSMTFATIMTTDDLGFPEGFVPTPGMDYTSCHINRFWTTGIWRHPAILPYNVIMKIDETCCFSIEDTKLPHFNHDHQNYKSHIFPGVVSKNQISLRGMYDFAIEYMTENTFYPTHSELWQKVHFTYHSVDSSTYAATTLPQFQDSFEVMRKDFMLREDVYRWLTSLTEDKPYGYYNLGWTVNTERVLTMSMFGTKTSIDTETVHGFVEKDLIRFKRNHKICTDPFTLEQ